MSTLDKIFSQIWMYYPLHLLPLFIAASFCGMCFAEEGKLVKVLPRSTIAADRALAELMSATTYSDLQQLALEWENDLSDQSRVKLLRALWIPNFIRITEPRRLAPLDGKALSSKHDLTLSAGRAVWAIEHLFDTNLPPVRSKLTATQLRELVDSWNTSFEKWACEKVEGRLSAMSRSERLEQARSPIPLIYPEEVLIIVDLLADDPDPEIRKEVLKSPWLQHGTVQRRLHVEDDTEITENLERFKRSAFSLRLSDLPKPDGW
jgi:hypothetical protein